MEWSTACPDWETRIVEGSSLIPIEPLYPDEAEAALEVFKGLKIVDAAGMPTFGEACDEFVFEFVAAIFGAYDAAAAKRRIREFFLLISKKNSKSTIAAGIAVTALLRNWRHSAELLVLAPSLEIANNVFVPAADMVRHDEELALLLDVKDHIRTIRHRTTKAELKVISADNDTVSGKKAAFVIVEEVWLFGKKPKANAMLREATGGLISRPEGFVLYLTTHSDEAPAGVYKAKLQYFRDVRDGIIHDPKSLGVLYEWPKQMLEDEAYLDIKNAYITNPNLGRSVDEEWLADKLLEAQQDGAEPGSLQVFLAKHLNVEIGMRLAQDRWAGADYWERGADPDLTFESLLERSEVCVVSLDGGGLDDLYGLSVIGRERDTRNWLHWGHALISPEGMERRKANNSRYEDFIADGDLTLVDGLPDDLDWVIERILMIKDAGLLATVGADPANIGAAVEALAKEEITQDAGLLTGVFQGIKLMGAIKTMERKLVDGSFKHCGQPMMTWCVGNAKVRQTSTGMMIERSLSGLGKIDPLMAAFDGAELMLRNPQPPTTVSVYENRGFLLV